MKPGRKQHYPPVGYDLQSHSIIPSTKKRSSSSSDADDNTHDGEDDYRLMSSEIASSSATAGSSRNPPPQDGTKASSSSTSHRRNEMHGSAVILRGTLEGSNSSRIQPPPMRATHEQFPLLPNAIAQMVSASKTDELFSPRGIAEDFLYQMIPLRGRDSSSLTGFFSYWLMSHPSQSQYSVGAISACTGLCTASYNIFSTIRYYLCSQYDVVDVQCQKLISWWIQYSRPILK